MLLILNHYMKILVQITSRLPLVLSEKVQRSKVSLCGAGDYLFILVEKDIYSCKS